MVVGDVGTSHTETIVSCLYIDNHINIHAPRICAPCSGAYGY